ncbi:MAG TPA: hypothetical protein PKD76_09810 [Solirubrobacterales bacterium]|nr:hypothetical protein [Solirubrobacterales bacterium]
MSADPVYAYIAGFTSVEDARSDFKEVKRLVQEGSIDPLDAALVYKGQDDTVHLRKREHRTVQGVWRGFAAGALAGVLLPPVMPVTATMNATRAGGMAYLIKGMPRRKVKELGDTLESGEAALILLGPAPVSSTLESALTRADRTVEERLGVTADEVLDLLAE